MWNGPISCFLLQKSFPPFPFPVVSQPVGSRSGPLLLSVLLDKFLADTANTLELRIYFNLQCGSVGLCVHVTLWFTVSTAAQKSREIEVQTLNTFVRESFSYLTSVHLFSSSACTKLCLSLSSSHSAW